MGSTKTFKQTRRIAIDAAMTVLLIFAYSCRITGNFTHKLTGAGLFVLFLTHVLINRHWFAAIFKNSYTPNRIFMTAVNILVALTAATTFITGGLETFCSSSLSAIENIITVREIHAAAAYWLMPLIGVHLGFHWKMLSMPSGANRVIITVMRILAFLFAVFGIWSFLDRNMFAKMFLGFSFDYWRSERPVILFFIQILSIIWIFVFTVYCLSKLIAWLKQAKNNGRRFL